MASVPPNFLMICICPALSCSEAIDPHGGCPEDRVALGRAKKRRRPDIGLDQVAVIGPQFLDRKIRAEEAAFGAEYCYRLGEDISDMGGIVAVNERSKSGNFRNDVGICRELSHP